MRSCSNTPCATTAEPASLFRLKTREVEKLRKELAQLETDFESNIVAVKAPVTFTKAELEGVPGACSIHPG